MAPTLNVFVTYVKVDSRSFCNHINHLVKQLRVVMYILGSEVTVPNAGTQCPFNHMAMVLCEILSLLLCTAKVSR